MRTESLTRWSTEYWLRRCQGYAVYSDGEDLGRVEQVVLTDDGEELRALVVRRPARGTLTVAAVAVLGVDAADERLTIEPRVAAAFRLAESCAASGER
jgi:sporulation protein YlmC with PRC-barrel domain